jgi:hypothetical protein
MTMLTMSFGIFIPSPLEKQGVKIMAKPLG